MRSQQKDTNTRTVDTDSNYVGFWNLSNQIHRQIAKRGFHFTLMVVGERGLGKTTLIKSLFRTELYSERHISKKASPSVNIEASTVDIEELGIRVRLTIVNTPGYADCLDDTNAKQILVNYIDEQFERYFNEEYGVNRRTISDHRVHCLLYFISSFTRGLKPLDIQCMKALQHRVNLIPIIAKADALTVDERLQLKQTILDQLSYHRIRIYQVPDCDPAEDPYLQEVNRHLKRALPLAIISSTHIVNVQGSRVRARMYPWGWIDVENPDHCDLTKLRTMLITHMHDLQEVTHESHYENYRLKKLQLNRFLHSPEQSTTFLRQEEGQTCRRVPSRSAKL